MTCPALCVQPDDDDDDHDHDGDDDEDDEDDDDDDDDDALKEVRPCIWRTIAKNFLFTKITFAVSRD